MDHGHHHGPPTSENISNVQTPSSAHNSYQTSSHRSSHHSNSHHSRHSNVQPSNHGSIKRIESEASIALKSKKTRSLVAVTLFFVLSVHSFFEGAALGRNKFLGKLSYGCR